MQSTVLEIVLVFSGLFAVCTFLVCYLEMAFFGIATKKTRRYNK